MSLKEHDNWLMTAEHIASGAPEDPDDLDTPAWHGYDILVHGRPERRLVEELHRRGIRSIGRMNLGYQFASDWPAGETPDTVVIDQLGRPQLHPNYLRHDGKLIYELCFNVRKTRDVLLKRAEEVMKRGHDGLFLDNAAPARRCWGPQFGRHEHIHADDPNARAEGHRPFCYSKAQRNYRFDVPIADEEQTYATAMLIGEIRDLVRSFCPDGAVMINGGDGSSVPPIFFEQVDAVLNEMFIYHTYLDFNLPVPTHLDFQDHDALDWLTTQEWEDQFQRRGVRIADYSTFSPHDPNRRRHVIFAFCAAKLWDNLFYTTPDPEFDAWLRDIRLGQPLADKPGSWGAVLYREYEGGIVAINPYGIAQQATIPWSDKPKEIELHGDARSPVADPFPVVSDSDGTITLKLFPDRAVIIVPAK